MITQEEHDKAQEVTNNNVDTPWVKVSSDAKKIGVDGWFNLEELEALAVLLRSDQQEAARKEESGT